MSSGGGRRQRCGGARLVTGELTERGEPITFAPQPSITLVSGVTDLAVLRAAIVWALGQHGYIVESENGSEIAVRLENRRTMLRMTIVYSPTQITVSYVDSNGLPIESSYASRRYDGWIRELVGSVQSELDRPAREAREAQERAAREAELERMRLEQQRQQQVVVIAPGSPGGASAPGDLIANGSFEQQAVAPGTFATLASTPGWATASGGGLELQNRVAGSAADGAQHIELDSTSNSAIYQDVSTLPGTFYELSYSYSPRPGVGLHSNVIEIDFGGRQVSAAIGPGDSLAETRWTRATVLVQATSTSTRLELRAAGASDGVGGYLDAISLVRAEVPSTPPVAPVVVPPGDNLIGNAGFESPGVAAGNFTIVWGIPSWGMASGPAVEVQNHVAGASFEGGQHIELDSDRPSAIAQQVATVPGGLYHLGLAYSPRPGVADNALEVWVGGRRVGRMAANGVGLTETAWVVLGFSVQAAADETVLELRDVSAPDGVGGYLDAVSFQPAPP